MKKDLTVIISLFLLFVLSGKTAFADDFIMPDWSYYTYREQANISENADEIKYEKIRREQSFDEYFDKQTIIIHKKQKDITPQRAGEMYLLKAINGDKRAEKYIIKNEENDFIACYCSHDRKKSEIIRFCNGFDGLIEIRYTHNNLWHFQNNIGSFLSTQMRIVHLPYEFFFNKLTGSKRLIRL